jgi:N-acetylmuramic acid 6-phosphate etherase
VLLGKTYGGLMVDVRPTNAKLWARAVRIVRRAVGLDDDAALALLKKAGGRAKVALIMHHAGCRAPGQGAAGRSTAARCGPSSAIWSDG